jgi:hypothetical protein
MRSLPFARAVAFGGVIVLAALAGVGAARADDVSNPNHPDKALQQKLDLLDHGSDTPDTTPPSPSVSEGSFPRSTLIPGTGTSIRVYGTGTETLRYSR